MEVDQVNERSSAAEQHMPFVEKYRPDDLSQIISHHEIVATSKYTFNFSDLYSPSLHRQQEAPALAVLWPTRYRKDLVHDRNCKAAVRKELQKYDAGA